MFVILLKFADNKAAARDHMAGHNAWLKDGFDEGVFLMAGSLQPALGGSLLAHNTTKAALAERVALDPFVAEGVVSAEILEIEPKRLDPRLEFLAA
ncbi:YciI family protein [Sneathiella limimaris]|uniref:YciI family protein n=1 Tax=Sneathiella limimaris TaxID=1964213 RepID=UPI00146BB28E|nr:YciI family protein [Sneathiella limimaris]